MITATATRGATAMSLNAYVPSLRVDGTSSISWDAETRRFVTFASDLTVLPGRVYDDACDRGYNLIGSRNGYQEHLVVEDHQEFDAEGDLLWTDYVPVRATSKALFAGFRVFND